MSVYHYILDSSVRFSSIGLGLFKFEIKCAIWNICIMRNYNVFSPKNKILKPLFEEFRFRCRIQISIFALDYFVYKIVPPQKNEFLKLRNLNFYLTRELF